VSILEDMRDNNEMKRLILTQGKNIDDEIVMQGLRLKQKKPRISEILGDAHPLSGSEEMEALKNYVKISRGLEE
jgi:hypothetical protein